jgi:peptidoglycan/xylan/chitin deacetylase (PgdA/CDA1 family)
MLRQSSPQNEHFDQLDAIEKAGIVGDGVIILSADHGGHDKTLGKRTRNNETMKIPDRIHSPDGSCARLSLMTRLVAPLRRCLLAIVLMTLIGVSTFWYREHRTVPGKDLWSVSYWMHRYHNQDLYDPRDEMLMHGNRALHEVALTFDDGPHTRGNSCITLLDTLKRYGTHATFFDVGKNMARNPALLKRTLAEGHEVGNHTMDHLRLLRLSTSACFHEINDASQEFFHLTGRQLVYLRPPGMHYDATILALTKSLGYMMIAYSVVCGDSDLRETPEFIRQRTVNRTENGSIILLHDYPPTASALPGILADLSAQGYRFVTISEMIAHLPEDQRHQALAFLDTQTNTQHKISPFR